MQFEGYTPIQHNDVTWFLLKSAPPTVKDALIPALSSSPFFKQAVPIKEGKYKSLWFFTPSDNRGEEYLIKRYINRRLFDRIKTIFIASKAIKELKAACGIHNREIPTPLPVAVGERSSWRMVREGYVVFKKLQECQPLNSYFLTEHPSSAPHYRMAERRGVIQALGSLARTVNEAGVFQSDFSLNNFLLTRDACGKPLIYLSDFEKITLRNTVTSTREITCLAKLNRVGREISLSDRMRFLRSYAGEKTEGHHLVALARKIQKRTLELLKQDYLRGRVTSVYTDALYQNYRGETVSGYFRRGYSIGEILSIIHRFDLLASSLPQTAGKEREAIQVSIDCNGKTRPLTVARYIPLSRTGSARSLWTTICTLALAGLPIDIPHAFMEVAVKNNQEGYLFFPRREGESDLAAFLNPSRSKEEIITLIDSLTRLLNRLHYFGVFSDRLTEASFSVVKEGGKRPSVHIKNIESFTMKREVTEDERKRDIALLNALIKKNSPTIALDVTRPSRQGYC